MVGAVCWGAAGLDVAQASLPLRWPLLPDESSAPVFHSQAKFVAKFTMPVNESNSYVARLLATRQPGQAHAHDAGTLGAAGAGRTTPLPPPEADLVALTPPPPQASARQICNFACSKVKSITKTEERFASDDPGLPAGRIAGEALTIRLTG